MPTLGGHLDIIGDSPPAPLPPDALNLDTFSQRIELQPISVHIGLLELIANDLCRRHYGMQAGEIKHVVKDLLALTRHHAPPL